MISNQGFSIIEVMVSLGIFSIAAASMTPYFISQMGANTQREIKSAAVAVAQQKMDELRLGNPATMPGTSSAQSVGATETYTVDGRNFSVVTTYCPTGTTFCSSASTRHIKVEVTWHNRRYFILETVYTQLQ